MFLNKILKGAEMKTLTILILTALMIYIGANICIIGVFHVEHINNQVTSYLENHPKQGE